MALLWSDLSTSAAEPQGRPVFSAPIPGVATNYLLTQTFQQQFSSFVALALNTPHPDYPDYILVEETQKEWLGCGEIRWQRIYAQVPAQHIGYTSMAYNFIGFTDAVVYHSDGNTTGTKRRDRFSRTVNVKVQYDYALVTSPLQVLSSLPIIEATEYTRSGIVEKGLITDFLLPVSSIPGVPTQTDPTQDEYLDWITADAADATLFHLVAEGSSLTQWRGNIYVRATKYIKAI